ncbi:MAG: glutamate-1-semialdehyde 2,1-aminomutase [Methanomicrobiales archaeon]|jgi:glutamate-1-semialdehyde 2,1-aminomutase|nr:glutamate-1-semialdehyde 2,1-aminomutase [Methanomicrobiales archaeon]
MKSSDLFDKARQVMPGGVSSPVRAIKPYPFYTRYASGSHLFTEDDNDLIDCCLAYGPLILGHANPIVMEAVKAQLARGWLYGTPSHLEPELAALIVEAHPGMEMVRFVSTGGEATMAAIRLARAFAGKPGIVKVEGGFHGAHDSVLIKAGSGATTLGIPDSAGVPPDVAAHTRQVSYNDPCALDSLLSRDEEIAAFILEPVLGNIGPILPEDGYLNDVRKITRDHGVLLIFDEVITGYRLGIGGTQVKYGIRPDITTLGKVAGGGFPLGVLGGPREMMEMIAPSGPVYQAGTFNGNPISLAAGITTITWLNEHREIYRVMEEATRVIEDAVAGLGVGSFVRTGSIFKYFFRRTHPRNYREAKECDTLAFSTFWKKMLDKGIFLPPSQFETNFLSTAHSQLDIQKIATAYQACL